MVKNRFEGGEMDFEFSKWIGYLTKNESLNKVFMRKNVDYIYRKSEVVRPFRSLKQNSKKPEVSINISVYKIIKVRY